MLDHAPLEAVYIYFDTETYDEIERDQKVRWPYGYIWVEVSFYYMYHKVIHSFGYDFKVTLEAQLGLIGGTMGLLTGFSILSGVELVYYLIRFLGTPC